MSNYVLSSIAEIIDCEHKTAPTVEASQYRSIRTTDIANGKIHIDKANRVSEDTYLEWSKKAIPESGDIILAREAPVGEVGWIANGYKVCLGQRTVLLKVIHSGVSKKFLLYYLANPDTRYNLQARSTGSVVAHLNVKDIRDFTVSLPPFPEQKAIASILSSLDDKIDLLHRQNKTFEAMAETLFRQWFVEGAEDNWEIIRITDLYEVRDGTHDSPKQEPVGYPLITSKHIQNGRIAIENAYLISKTDFDKVSERSKVDTGDILFSMIGTIGLIFYERSKDISYAIKNIGLFKTSQNPVWAIYTYLWLKSPTGKQYIDKHKSGSTQEYVSLGSLRGIAFQKPPEILLTEFNQMASNWFTKIYSNQKQINTLETLRDTLLPKLMSGEVRVAV